MPIVFPQCSHITRKRGIYHFRKRFPGPARGEVTVSLATRSYREADPRLFPTERAFRTQLGRRVRHLATTSRATYWHPAECRFKGVYRDPSPRAAVIIGEMLAEIFGVAGAMFAKQEQAEADAKAREREAFYAALHDVAPRVA